MALFYKSPIVSDKDVITKLSVTASVHVLHFSEGAVPCRFLKSQKCTLPFVKIAPRPLSEMKNKPCLFPTISWA